MAHYDEIAASRWESDGDWAYFGTVGVPKRLEKGRVIYLQGQEPQYLYYLAKGRVRAFLSSGEGEERTLAIYEAGSIFGEASFFDGLPRVSSAVALTDCRVAAIDRATVMEAFSRRPALALKMLGYLAKTVRQLSGQVDHISFLTADKRLVRLLLLWARDGWVEMSQEDMAAGVGVSRVTVNRVLRQLAKRGLVETFYGGVRLLNPAALAAELEEA